MTLDNNKKNPIFGAGRINQAPIGATKGTIAAGLAMFRKGSTSKKVGSLLAIFAVALAVISVVNFQFNIIREETRESILNDAKFIPTVKEISATIPHDKGTVVTVSSNGPHITYFTGLRAVSPYGVSSEPSLVDFMKSKKSEYLIVIENKADEPKLRPLFSSQGLKLLNGDFQKMSSYKSDQFTFHLYRLANSQSIEIVSPLAGDTISGPSTGVLVSVKGRLLSPSFAKDGDESFAKITKVEVVVDNLYPYQLAKPGSTEPDDWSSWSYQILITSEGTHQIVVRSTDSAGNQRWVGQSVKVVFTDNDGTGK
ncbi:hypothetical protein [Candidatus Nitrososphaera evergladensis]|uniref:hypothetical protein n=1 Tax=Candidatus Nitrososphaera evergladensis TaxID=1459637 RepID=UPI0011E5C53A|nr:hypothetical protein [Candidatus Nitrososphaera evergladensis]